MSRAMMVLLFLPLSCLTYGPLSLPPPQDDLTMLETVARIKHHLGSVPVTVVHSTDYELNNIQDMLQEKIGSFQISEYDHLSSKLTICLIRDDRDIFRMKNRFFWDPNNYYFIYFTRNEPESEQIFQYLWNTFLIYRVFVTYRTSEIIKTYDPISNGIQNNFMSTLDASNLFTTKLPDWNRSKFFAVFAGHFNENFTKNTRSFLTDMYVLKTVTERLNLKLYINNSTDEFVKFGFRDNTGTYRGALKDLAVNIGNITANVHFLKMNNILEHFTYSVYARADKICIALPKTKQIPKFVESFKSFNTTVWLSIILIYVATATSLKYFRYLFSQGNNQRLSDVNLPLVMFGISLGLPVVYGARLHFEKILLCAILLVSFVVVSILQSTLKTILSTPPTYYKFPISREEFNEQRVLVWTSSQDLIDSFKAVGYTGVSFHLKTPLEQKMDLVNVNYKVGILEKVGAILDTKWMAFLTPKLKLTQACPVQHNVAYIFLRGSPFEDPINRILSILVESGLMSKWDRLVYEQPHRIIQFVYKHAEPIHVKPLCLKDLGVPFYFSSLGFILAILAFIAEILIQYLLI